MKIPRLKKLYRLPLENLAFKSFRPCVIARAQVVYEEADWLEKVPGCPYMEI